MVRKGPCCGVDRALPGVPDQIFLIGAFRGGLFPMSANPGSGVVVVVVLAAVVDTLLVIPTAGRSPTCTPGARRSRRGAGRGLAGHAARGESTRDL